MWGREEGEGEEGVKRGEEAWGGGRGGGQVLAVEEEKGEKKGVLEGPRVFLLLVFLCSPNVTRRCDVWDCRT